MKREEYPEFRDRDTILLKGHQIALEDIVALFDEGCTVSEIGLHYRELNDETMYAVIAYYLHCKLEVDAYMAHLTKSPGRRNGKRLELEQDLVRRRMRALNKAHRRAALE